VTSNPPQCGAFITFAIESQQYRCLVIQSFIMPVSFRVRKKNERANKAARRNEAKKQLIRSLEEPCPHGDGLFTKMIRQTKFASILDDDGEPMPKLGSLMQEFKTRTRIDEEYVVEGVNHKRYNTLKCGLSEHFTTQQKKVTHWKLNLILSEQDVTQTILWKEVKKSTLDDAGLGLFISRDVKEGERIGMFLGKQVKESVTPSEYAMETKELGLIDPKRGFGDNDNPAFYLGAHMMNDPTFGLEKDTEEWEKALRQVNVTLYANLFIVADRDLKAGEELFLLYDSMDNRSVPGGGKKRGRVAETNMRGRRRTK
jgi:hypothetical protein